MNTESHIIEREEPIVSAAGLKMHFQARLGIVRSLLGQTPLAVKALDGVDVSLDRSRIVGLVGESGCGKSTLGMTLVRMYQPSGGQILFEGRDVTHVHGGDLKSYQRQAQIIFQDPYSSLNPRLTIGQIVEEPLIIHQIGTGYERLEKVRRALTRVRMLPDEYLDRFPSDLSGGQRQRVAIARALVLEPKFIVADEPVSMLDVSIQASVLELLNDLSRELGLAVLYISHDIATVGYICDHIMVMYLGMVVEEGSVREVLGAPKHPYTRRLLAAIPEISPGRKRERIELKGEVPTPLNVPPGCRFSSRCPFKTDLCESQVPMLADVGRTHRVRCHAWPEATPGGSVALPRPVVT
jgi:oligopeptide/dipeptide ABC transporter ATP-binding protein